MTANSSTDSDPRQPLIPAHDAVNQPGLWRWLDICPHAQTMTAYDLTAGEFLCYALPCNEWSCRHCATRKTKALSMKTERAKPNRLCTLTVDPKLFETPRHAFDATRRQLPEWVKRIRSRFGEFEYLRVTEVTKAGWPHYHMLVRSDYIPHAVARDAWYELTGARIIDVRRVKENFPTYRYLLKYLTKMHHITWTGRHVSYSRGFFKPDDDPQFAPHDLQEREVHNMHPAAFIMESHPGCRVEKLTARTYRIHAGSRKPPVPKVSPPTQKQAFPTRPRYE